MSQPQAQLQANDCPWGIYHDAVHILSVDYERQAARLYENGGSGEGRLLIKSHEAAAKIDIADPFQLINLAFHFVISYDVISQVAAPDVMKFFEQTGVKEFLDRMVSVTPEADRRGRFDGLSPKFINFVQDQKPVERKYKST